MAKTDMRKKNRNGYTIHNLRLDPNKTIPVSKDHDKTIQVGKTPRKMLVYEAN